MSLKRTLLRGQLRQAGWCGPKARGRASRGRRTLNAAEQVQTVRTIWKLNRELRRQAEVNHG